MIHAAITELLQQTIGLNITSIGPGLLERSVAQRMAALGIANQQQYIDLLAERQSEMARLIEEVTIPETWFFRDSHAFQALRDIACRRLAAGRQQQPLRILSLPCATGEEPYSIAMALALEHYPLARVRIDAVDISKRAIARARKGFFRRNSFRSDDLGFRDRYFRPQGNGYMLHHRIRDAVQFFCGNILNPGFMAQFGGYDIIFCKNILIYLNYESRLRIIELIKTMLLPDGILFAGAAEISLYFPHGFQPVQPDKSFMLTRDTSRLWRYTGCSPSPLRPSGLSGRNPAPSAKHYSPDAAAHKAMPRRRKTKAATGTAAHQQGQARLQRARQLADQGRLAEAKKICRDYLASVGDHGECFFLLGVIADFEGELFTAMRLLRRALYHIPDHTEALTLLGYLAERAGDHQGALYYRQRLRTLNPNP